MFPTQQTTRLWIAINLAQRTVYKAIEVALKAEGLPPLNWYDILWDLERNPNGVRPFELEKTLLFEQSNLSRVLKKMILQEIIESRTSAKDGRGKLLHITPSGRGVRKSMWQIYGPIMQKHLGGPPEYRDAESIIEGLNSVVARQIKDHCL